MAALGIQHVLSYLCGGPLFIRVCFNLECANLVTATLFAFHRDQSKQYAVPCMLNQLFRMSFSASESVPLRGTARYGVVPRI